MDESPGINGKIILVDVESQAVKGLRAEHGLSAVDVIVHDVFKDWQSGVLIYFVKVYFGISGYLELIGSFDIENKTSEIKLKVLLPKPSI
jgi:hypothetical protein